MVSLVWIAQTCFCRSGGRRDVSSPPMVGLEASSELRPRPPPDLRFKDRRSLAVFWFRVRSSLRLNPESRTTFPHLAVSAAIKTPALPASTRSS